MNTIEKKAILACEQLEAARAAKEPIDLHIQTIRNAQNLIDACLRRIEPYPEAVAHFGYRIVSEPMLGLVPLKDDSKNGKRKKVRQ